MRLICVKRTGFCVKEWIYAALSVQGLGEAAQSVAEESIFILAAGVKENHVKFSRATPNHADYNDEQ